MNKRQQNTHDMHLAVLTLLNSKRAAWGDIEDVAEAVAALQSAADQTAVIAGERDGLATKGLTVGKASARDAMEDAAMRLVLAVRPFARATGDDALLAEVDISAAGFDRLTDAKAVSRATRIRVATEGRLADLARVKVARKDVDALAAAIEAFQPLGASRDATEGQREARTAGLAAPFKAARKALRLLDDYVPGVVGDPVLAAEYARVRRTDDR